MMYHAVLNADFDLGEIPTYEDVELLPPNKNHKRPLILIGKHYMKMLNCYLQIKNINVHLF